MLPRLILRRLMTPLTLNPPVMTRLPTLSPILSAMSACLASAVLAVCLVGILDSLISEGVGPADMEPVAIQEARAVPRPPEPRDLARLHVPPCRESSQKTCRLPSSRATPEQASGSVRARLRSVCGPSVDDLDWLAESNQ